MSLYKRGNVWWIEISSDGRRIRESTGATEKKAAQEYQAHRRDELWRQLKLGERPQVTWGEAVAKWLKVKNRGLAERYMIGALKIPPKDLLPLDAKKLADAIPSDSPGSWNRYLSLVTAIHSASKVDPPEIERKPNPAGRTRWLTAEEWERLRKTLDEESPLLRQAAEFTLATGLRENNVLNLEWSQIDLKNRHAWLHADQMKGGAPLGVRLTDAAIAVLQERKGENKTYVFAHPFTGKPLYKASMRAWYVALRKAKIKGFRWHDLRHTWASWHVMGGTRIEELQQLGGWKTLSMVQRYSHLASSHLAKIAENAKPVSLRYNARKRGD